MAAGAPDPKKAEAEALYAEFLRRAAEGDRQNLSELCGHHPQLADELLELYERNETVSMRAPAETDHHEDFGSPPAALTTRNDTEFSSGWPRGGWGSSTRSGTGVCTANWP